MEQKTFFKSHGKRIPAIIDFPPANGKAPAIVLCHGFLGRKEQKLLSVSAHALSEAGFTTLRFDFGGANANKPWKKMPCVSMHVREALDALAFVRKLKQVDARRVVLGGHSYGANICLLAAARDKTIVACVFFAPGREFQQYSPFFKDHELKLFGRSFSVSRQALREWTENDLRKALKEVRKPILVIAAGEDEYVPLPTLRKRFAGSRTKIAVLKNADHFFKGKTREAAKLALELIKKLL
ncbi:MAG: alpha/beta fold hydrolase [Candidatus Micrarchaeota archaeon]